jgi:hypothetical protein
MSNKASQFERAIRAVAGGLWLALCPLAMGAVDVPVVSADLGPCTADFTVWDSAKKPLYNAKVHVKIAYGFMSKRSQDLTIGTNSDGKARIEGIPDRLKKKPLEFQVSSGSQTKTVTQDPEVNCHASFDAVLPAP